MTASGIMASVIFANGLTAAFVYALWRLRRNEHDLTAIGMVLACCLAVGLIALSAR